MKLLIDLVLRLHPPELATEDAACNAVFALRFPNGATCPRCGCSCARSGLWLQCSRANTPHKFTIFVGTALETKRALSVRALFIVIRALAMTHRSISARELARDLSISHVSLWRHIHTVRALLNRVPLRPTVLASTTALSESSAIRCGGRAALAPTRVRPRGAWYALTGQCVRTWINGTFHGVSHEWLALYLREMASRWFYDPITIAHDLLAQLIKQTPPLTFSRLRTVACRP